MGEKAAYSPVLLRRQAKPNTSGVRRTSQALMRSALPWGQTMRRRCSFPGQSTRAYQALGAGGLAAIAKAEAHPHPAHQNRTTLAAAVLGLKRRCR
jgi:hypothetical protein